MAYVDRLKKMRNVKKVGRIAIRLQILIVYLTTGETFVKTGLGLGMNRRTVAKWYKRFDKGKKSVKGIREAPSDRPRSGRPAFSKIF